MLIGKKIILRAIESDDLPLLRDWRNTEDFRKYFREYQELNLANQDLWFKKYVVEDKNTLMFMIEDKESGTPIGVCGLCYINWIHRNADLSIYIGKDNLYIDTEKNGYAFDVFDQLFEYGFNRLNLHKIWCEIYSFDEKKHELFKNYGLKQDGVLRDNYFYDGEYQDSHLFSILSSEWRLKYR